MSVCTSACVWVGGRGLVDELGCQFERIVNYTIYLIAPPKKVENRNHSYTILKNFLPKIVNPPHIPNKPFTREENTGPTLLIKT